MDPTTGEFALFADVDCGCRPVIYFNRSQFANVAVEDATVNQEVDMSEQNNRPEEIDIDSRFVDKMQPISTTEDINKLQEEFSKNSAEYLDELLKSMNENANDEFEKLLQEQEVLLYSLSEGDES